MKRALGGHVDILRAAVAATVRKILLETSLRENKRWFLNLEPLESRQLLTDVVLTDDLGVNNVYYFRRSDDDRHIEYWTTADHSGAKVIYSRDNTARFTIEANAGDDVIILDCTYGNPFHDGVLEFNGGEGLDTFKVIHHAGAASRITYTPIFGSDDGTITTGTRQNRFVDVESVDASQVHTLTLITPNGADTLDIEASGTMANTVSGTSGGIGFTPLTFSATTTLVLDADEAASAPADQEDHITIDGAGIVSVSPASGSTLSIPTELRPMVGLGENTLTISGGSVSLNADDSAISGRHLAVIVNDVNDEEIPDTTLRLTGTQYLKSLTLNGSAQAILPAVTLATGTTAESPYKVLVLGELIIPPTANPDARLDLTDNALILKQTHVDDALILVRRGLNASSTNEFWEGGGITSSLAATYPDLVTAVGLVKAGEALVSGDGREIAATDLFIKFTYFGDANFDGVVNGTDYFIIDENGPTTPGDWLHGDFDYSGGIDGTDYFLIDNSFGVSGTHTPPTFTLPDGGEVEEEELYSLNLTVSTGPDIPAISAWTVYWGDGTSSVHPADADGSTVVTHRYLDDSDTGNRDVRAFAKGPQFNYYAGSLEVTVRKRVHDFTLSGESEISEGANYVLNLDWVDVGYDEVDIVEIDWGDGSTPEEFHGDYHWFNHTYQDDRPTPYTIKVTVTDTGFDWTVLEKAVTVNDIPAGPKVNSIVNVDGSEIDIEDLPTQNITIPGPNGPVTVEAIVGPEIDEGSRYELKLKPGDQVDRWRINWGDGTQEDLPGPTEVAHHIYGNSDPDGYTIRIFSYDRDGETEAKPVVARVVNKDPVARFIATAMPELKRIQFSFAQVSDPSPVDRHWLVYHVKFPLREPQGEVTHREVLSPDPTNDGFQLDLSWISEAGTFSVEGWVTDPDGGTSAHQTLTYTITVSAEDRDWPPPGGDGGDFGGDYPPGPPPDVPPGTPIPPRSGNDGDTVGQFGWGRIGISSVPGGGGGDLLWPGDVDQNGGNNADPGPPPDGNGDPTPPYDPNDDPNDPTDDVNDPCLPVEPQHQVDVDVHIDSDSDDRPRNPQWGDYDNFGFSSEDFGPYRTWVGGNEDEAWEDFIEGNRARSGMFIPVNDDDLDFDGIPDFADGFDWSADDPRDDDEFDNLYDYFIDRARHFRPIDLWIAGVGPGIPGVDPNDARIVIYYDASDPMEVERAGAGTFQDPYVYHRPSGNLRLWKARTPRRDGLPLEEGGDFIRSGVPYTYDQIFGGSSSFFLEAVGLPSQAGSHRITVRVVADGPTCSKLGEDMVRVTIVGGDAHAGASAPPTLEGAAAEDAVEWKDLRPANIIVANTGDKDADGVVDFADWNNEHENLFPIHLKLPAGLRADRATVIFEYSASDPSKVVRVGEGDTGWIPAPGQFRLWINNEPGRDNRALADDGYYIPPGQGVKVETLTDVDGIVYVEGIGTAFDSDAIRVFVDPDGDGLALPVEVDTVRLTVLTPENADYFSGAIRVADGTTHITTTDFAVAGFGETSGVTRTWTNEASIAMFGPGGSGVRFDLLPYVIDAVNSVLVVWGQQIHYFDRRRDNTYAARFGDLSTLLLQDDQFRFIDPSGRQAIFHSATDPLFHKRGQVHKVIDPGGNETSYAYDDAGRVTDVDRFGRESFTFTYFSDTEEEGNHRWLVKSITMKRASQLVRKVEYTHADYGDVRRGVYAPIQTAVVSGPSGELDKSIHVFPWGPMLEPNEGEETRPGYLGPPLLLHYIDPQGFARSIGTEDEAPLWSGDLQIALRYAKYTIAPGDGTIFQKIRGAGSLNETDPSGYGNYSYRFAPYSSLRAYGPNVWKYRTEIINPDLTSTIVYANANQQTTMEVLRDDFELAGPQWNTFYRRDHAGRVLWEVTPSAIPAFLEPDYGTEKVEGYSSMPATPLRAREGGNGVNYELVDDEVGLIHAYTYHAATTATSEDAGAVEGLLNETWLLRGDDGEIEARLSTLRYKSRDHAGATIYLPGQQIEYPEADSDGASLTRYEYTAWDGFQPTEVIVHLPQVSTAEHGSGADAITTTYDSFGRVVSSIDGEGHESITEYDPVSGSINRREVILDASNSVFTDYTNFDEIGRPRWMIDPNDELTTYEYVDSLTERKVTVTPAAGPSQTIRHDLANLTIDTFTGGIL